ncbi:MAG: protein translocase subunit SecD [Rickettsiales bacterium]|nr:protein translocase subunit SecD [Rickettsiales bacterium]
MLNFPNWKILFAAIVCLWGFYQASGNFISEETRKNNSFLPQQTIRLGLDLQGGSQLLLEVDFENFLKNQLEVLSDDLRRSFRKGKIGYKNLKISKDKEKIYKITLGLIENSKFDNLKAQIREVSSEFSVEENKNIVEIFYNSDVLKNLKRDVLEKSIEIVRRRVDETGTREPIIQMQGDSRILLQVPGLDNPESLKKLLGKTAKMTFHLMDNSNPFAVGVNRAKPGYLLLSSAISQEKGNFLVKKEVEISGESLIDAQATYNEGQPVVSFKFNNQGGKKFAKVTADNVGKPFAIVLDGKVITAPRINEAILSGSGIISGSFTIEEANDLALLLRSGALPAPLSILEERSVGPSLGKDSIESGSKASLLGAGLIMLIMFAIYRKFGFFANIALFINLVLTIALLSLFNATLTLPGIAGIALGLGMAVDANILIYERIKEEIKLGKSPFAAIDSGFKMALATIVDSNLTTIISTIILFIYGSGVIKGFAVTLTIGIICSMFSAIMLTKMQIFLWAKYTKPKTLRV